MKTTASGLFALFAAVALFVTLAMVMMPFVPDDAYVSFRYAEHLADTKELTFNTHGEPVEGYSSFLWVVLCAAVHSLGIELPRTMPYVGLFFGALNIVTLWAIYRRRSAAAWSLLLPLVLFASSGPFLTYAVSGMETPLFSLLLLLTVFFLDRALSGGGRGSYLMTAVVCLLLSLCRPEGLLAFPAIVVYVVRHLRNTRNAPARTTHLRGLRIASIVFVAGVTVYQSWRMTHFGSWLPTTFHAAGGTAPLASWAENIPAYLVMHGYDYPPMGYYYLAVALLAVIGASSYGTGARVRIPVQIGHPFRLKSATDSGVNRPPIPGQIGHPKSR